MRQPNYPDVQLDLLEKRLREEELRPAFKKRKHEPGLVHRLEKIVSECGLELESGSVSVNGFNTCELTVAVSTGYVDVIISAEELAMSEAELTDVRNPPVSV